MTKDDVILRNALRGVSSIPPNNYESLLSPYTDMSSGYTPVQNSVPTGVSAVNVNSAAPIPLDLLMDADQHLNAENQRRWRDFVGNLGNAFFEARS